MKLTSGLRYPGGKFYWGQWIYSNIRPHTDWLDGMCGGLSVTLAGSPDRGEVCNDLDSDLINYYRCVQDFPEELTARLDDFDYSQESFDWAADYAGGDYVHPNVEYAAKYLIRNRMSRDGGMKQFTTSPRVRRGMPEMESSYLSAIDNILPLSKRIFNVVFTSVDILLLIDEWKKCKNAVIYLDPPYLISKTSKRKTKNLYKCEVDHAFHVKLLGAVQDSDAQVVISMYGDPLYLESLAEWNRVEKSVALNMGGAKKKKDGRVEYLWWR